MPAPASPPLPDRRRRPLVGAVVLAVCAALGTGDPTTAAQTQASRRHGRIVGMVTVSEALPPNPLADMVIPPPSIVRGDPEILKVVVYLKSAPRAQTATTATTVAELAQVEQEFVPGVLPVQVGTTVKFLNGDPLFHNVFSLSPLGTFNLGQYPKGQSRSFRFMRPGVVKVFCKIHSFMSAVVLVLDHPWFTMPARDGAFTLERIPPGRHRLVTWHERGAPLEQDVVVRAGADTRVTITYPGSASTGTQP
jgi:plastocyanin